MKKLIKCGKLFNSKAGTVSENMAILVEDNKIVKVDAVCNMDAADAQVIDLSDKFVMPGLIDCHQHCAFYGQGNNLPNVYEQNLAYNAFEAAKNVKLDLMAGFTTLRDAGGPGFVDVSLKKYINAGVLDGPRMVCAGRGLTSTGGHGDMHLGKHVPAEANPMSIICNSPEEMRAAARLNFKYGADAIKIMATGGVMSYGDDPNASQFTYEEMKAAIDVAKEQGKTTFAHAHGANGIKTAIRAGITSIEHGMLIDQEGIDMMVEHGTWMVPTIIAAKNIVVYGAGTLPQWMIDKAAMVLENHKDNCMQLRERGVKFAFGSDAASGFNCHGQQAREFANLVDFGFPAHEALQHATCNAAQLLQMGDQVGSIEEGYFADIVAFDADPLKDITVMQNCTFVMKDGKVYKQ